MKTSLVTGGAGFVGSHIVDKLIELGHNVIVIDNYSTGKKENENKNAKYYNVDIRRKIKIKEKIDGYIIHCAAMARIQPSFKNTDLCFQTNVIGTYNILEFAKKNKIEKFIYLGSSSAYGNTNLPLDTPLNEENQNNPGSPYSSFKILGEILTKDYNKIFKVPSVICRLFNVYGNRQIIEGTYATVIGIFLEQYKKGEHLTIVGDGQQRRDFTHINDAVNGILLSARSGYQNTELFNIGNGKNYSIKEIADMISEKQICLPERKGEYPYTLADINKAKNKLGYKPKENLFDYLLNEINI